MRAAHAVGGARKTSSPRKLTDSVDLKVSVVQNIRFNAFCLLLLQKEITTCIYVLHRIRLLMCTAVVDKSLFATATENVASPDIKSVKIG